MSEELDFNVRHLLKSLVGAHGRSAFAQEAMSIEMLRHTIRDIQKDNKDLAPEDAQALADEAAAWARENPDKRASSPSQSCDYDSN